MTTIVCKFRSNFIYIYLKKGNWKKCFPGSLIYLTLVVLSVIIGV